MIVRLKLIICFLAITAFPEQSRSDEIEGMHPERERSREYIREILEVSRTYFEANDADHGIEKIGIERRPTFGTTASYTLIISKDGSFRYVGRGGAGVTRVGTYTGTISEWLFNRLSHYVVEIEYMTLPDDYRVGATDQDFVFTMVVSEGIRKTIMNYGNGGPAGLWALEQAIENTMRYAEWDD